MRHIYLFILLLTLAAALPSCRKDAPELMNPNEVGLNNTPSQVFKTFWHGMNNTYAFWDIDPTDWDRVYDEYLPVFQEMDKLLPVPEEELDNYYCTLQDIYTEICKNLVDHHYGLYFYKNKAFLFGVTPGNDEAMSRDYAHDRIIMETIVGCINANKQAGRIEEYVGGNYYVQDDDDNMSAVSYKIDGVAYIFFTGFSFAGAIAKDPGGEVEQVLRNFQRIVLETPDLKGVIIDVRDNGGGYLADMQELLAPMIDTDLLIGYTRVKEGLGRLDYGPWVPSILSPAKKHRKVGVPVVVLANLWSVSMSEMTAMAVSALPNGCVIGERTFGGNGPLDGNYKITYSGIVSNNAMEIYCSTAMMKDAKGRIHEGVGITPDIEIVQDAQVEAAMRSGVDPQLERALEYIRTGK